MQITITARHFELTKAIRDYVESSCLKLKKYFDPIITIHVTLALENSRNICELSMHAGKFSLQSQAEEMDMYLSIDNGLERMESQIKKLKDRVTDHQKRALKDQFTNFSRASDFTLNQDNRERTTIKTKRVVTEPLNIHEAIEKMDEVREDFFIFRNIETDRINVLVKKDKVNFKLFEP
ncbi:MAG: ribosome-associated translation inhibitor RaiA [Candidatus Cloacimonadaceae bacterium]|jgi:putative sigma-54 modulation protein|nr:ribosome-associated translation inhibitor RaiA [Candidatus Cloacimonadota bacterium]MDY0128200.1 ribosome-associated translation inhibitor RaiA [Candidatus Cloacimonadaceae bacterium]MCB5254549.1 ribosome-associated translation inhibitor RaiA [Candidatus Cloacimonadota bacterium]MCK9178632.1 ribosome-associated translation inhibitor RaiA [Candidatus Cloacimonadota bacterium]MCK9242972.1 ribosome-associated translation inhibitor RaiA [Candidatus Cloacimonadota bacterium]